MANSKWLENDLAKYGRAVALLDQAMLDTTKAWKRIKNGCWIDAINKGINPEDDGGDLGAELVHRSEKRARN